MAAFVTKAGYNGLLVGLDEMVVLSHRLPNSRARQANYEALLTILNDCVQGVAKGLGFLFAGTDECLEDKRRGLFSYEALRSRLAENTLAKQQGLVDLAGGAFTPDRLVSFIGDPTSERFDDLVPPDLLGEAYVREFLNISGAREALQSFI